VSGALDSSVLVLNRYYSPINLTTGRRAFCMLFASIAEAVAVVDETYQNYDFHSWAELSSFHSQNDDMNDHDWVRTPNLILLVPRIIRVLNYDRPRTYRVRLTRKNLYFRDNNTCQYCGRNLKSKDLNIDHIIPRSRGGKDTWDNLVCACISCNIRKANRLPNEAGMTLVRRPQRPRLNPAIVSHLGKKKYASWKSFLDEAYWNVELRE
jgi:5-methylcytosine-specific restriction endonuclease McrA